MKKYLAKTEISPKQFQVLSAIYQFQIQKPYSVTISNVAEKLQISRTTAFEHIAALREKGLIEQPTGKYRCLKPTTQGCAFIKKAQRQINLFEDNYRNCSNDGIVLAGKVAAGKPIETLENNQTLNLSEKFGQSNVFALEVCGESMIEDDIKNGDWVICKKAQHAENGQLAIVIVEDNSATLKRFFKEKKHARLQPANPDFKPILTKNCRIEAVVIGLVRKF